MDLRPLSLGELLDRAFTLYRRHLWLFVGVMAVPSVFALAVGLLSAWFQQTTRAISSNAGGAPAAETIAMFLGLAGAMMVALLAYFVVYTVALGAISLAVSELYVGRTATIVDVFRRMRGRVGRLLMLMLLVMVRVGAVAFAGIVLVIASAATALAGSPFLTLIVVFLGLLASGCLCSFMLLRYGVAVPALVLEGLTARNAIRRSIELTEGSRLRVLLLFVCVTVISYAGMALFQGPFLMAALFAGTDTTQGFWLNLAGVVSGTIGSTFTGPIMIVGLALLYYDTRIRHEALDLDLMIDALDGQGSRTEPARA